MVSSHHFTLGAKWKVWNSFLDSIWVTISFLKNEICNTGSSHHFTLGSKWDTFLDSIWETICILGKKLWNLHYWVKGRPKTNLCTAFLDRPYLLNGSSGIYLTNNLLVQGGIRSSNSFVLSQQPSLGSRALWTPLVPLGGGPAPIFIADCWILDFCVAGLRRKIGGTKPRYTIRAR